MTHLRLMCGRQAALKRCMLSACHPCTYWHTHPSTFHFTRPSHCRAAASSQSVMRRRWWPWTAPE